MRITEYINGKFRTEGEDVNVYGKIIVQLFVKE